MERGLFEKRAHIANQENRRDVFLGDFLHNGQLFDVTQEPFFQFDDIQGSFTRFNIYAKNGKNVAYIVGEMKRDQDDSLIFIVDKSKNFENPYKNPQYRSLVKGFIRTMINLGVIWQSDEIDFLSDKQTKGNDSGRNALHMYQSLVKDSCSPQANFTCEIENNRYVLRKKRIAVLPEAV